MKVILDTLKVGDFFFHYEEYEDGDYRDLEICKFIEKNNNGHVITKTVYHFEDDMENNCFLIPKILTVGKLIPNNILSKLMYPDYVECKEVKGYLIEKRFYKIKKELDAMN